MKIPKELTTATSVSKILAAILFISLPFIGFFLGVSYQGMTDLAKSQQEVNNISIVRVPTPTPIAFPTLDLSITANWKTYENDKLSISYPETWQIDNSSIALLYPGIALRSKDYEIEKSGNLNLINGYSISLRIQNVPWGIPGSPGDENVTPLFTKETRWLNEKAWLREYNYEGIETILTTIHKNVPYQMIMESASYNIRENNELLFIQVANTLKIK